MIEGVDVSTWQRTTPHLSGLGFLFARATYGAVHDGMYHTHITNARNAGLLVGAYHFGVGDVSVPDQVSAFLASAGAVDFYVLDLERNGSRPSMTQAQARDFISRVKATGRKIGLYASASGYPTGLGQDYRWVAQWTTHPPVLPFTFWQYQGSPLDRDRFGGTLSMLKTLAGKQVVPAYHISFTGAFWVYTTDGKPFTDSRGVHYGGTITGRHAKRFSGPTGAPCEAPLPYAWSGGTRRLVKVTAGGLAGQYVGLGSTAKLETT